MGRMSDDLFTIHTDGGSRGNPGPAACAYVIERTGAQPIEVKCFLGRMTNNVAEYTGLVQALEHARELGARRLLVYSDSELMVKQLNGDYRVKNEGLRPLYEQAAALVASFPSVTIRHVRREQNTRADALCNEAMDDPRSAPPRAAGVVAPAPIVDDPLAQVRRRALALLEESAARWADADPAAPQVAEVWDQLLRLLRDAGALRI